LEQFDIAPDAIFSGADIPAARGLMATVAHDISATLATLRPQIRALSKPQRVALLPIATITPYLRCIGHQRRNPLRDIAELAPLARVWRIALAHLTGRV
jgi:15-cis-phytoene synthase